MGEETHPAEKKPRGQKRAAGKSAKPAASTACPIVGIGASAGGLEAFSRLLRALPEHLAMAIVVVQHLDPNQESRLPEILGRNSRLPVLSAEDGMLVEQDRVYVMPAGVTMEVAGGTLKLTARPKEPVRSLPIDTLLRSMAASCGNLSIGVVLSGTGSDGVLGLHAIKDAGGLTFAQDPVSAEYEGMPRASIDAGVVDAALDPEHLAAELVRISAHPELGHPEPTEKTEAQGDLDDESLGEVITLLREATGLDFSGYRRTSLLRRISRRMLLSGQPTIKEYLRRLRERPAEVEMLYRDVLVNMTEFFRDPGALEALKREVFPEILARTGPEGPIRIWVPGCSKGQEAYSVLMTLIEFLDGEEVRPEIQIFASDVNGRDIDFARAGVYPAGIAQEVSPQRLARFFAQVPGGYQVDRSIREMCVFAVHDVTADPPFSKLDLVTFRNVLIYMERPLQKRVLQILHYALQPGGFLLLGSSESTGSESSLFSVVDKKHRIYKRKPGPGRLLPALAPSARVTGFAKKGAREPVPVFDILAEAEKVVQAGYQPAALLVTSDLDVLQFRGRVGLYLDPAEGPPDLKLPKLVAPGLASSIEAAIREAAKTKAAATRRWTSQDHHGVSRETDVEAVPITAPTGESYYLVLFKERPKEGVRARARTKRGDARTPDEAELPGVQRELDETREQLEAALAERDSASRDLRATSERFQSTNEELRTINEEFQTAQEELQSTNEELTTLNDELRNRNTELNVLADDLNNVIEGVEIPILILDPGLRIRRFTPQAEAIVSIVPADVGRPITDFSMKVGIPDFADRIREVLSQGVPSQTEARSVEGRWYSMRLRPYKTGEGETAGVVVAFIDIDELKKTTDIAAASRDHAEAVVATMHEPLLTLEQGLRVREANDAFYQTFAVSADETIGRGVYELGDGQWDFPELRSLLEQVLPGDREFANLVVEREFPRIGHRVMELYARRVREEQGTILLAINDITEVTKRTRLSKVLNDISVEIVSTLEFDQVLERILKVSAEAIGAQSAALLVEREGAWIIKGAYGLTRTVEEWVFDQQALPVSASAPQVAVPVLLEPAEAERFISNLGVTAERASVLGVPLLLRKEKLGFVSFHYSTDSPPLGGAEMDFASRLGTTLSLAFENSKLYNIQREIADTLQSALLTTPRRISGIDFGYLYRSATTAAAVGGDFFDLFELDDGRAAVLLGDVSGKGVQAATLTALVKNTVRTLAYENDSPAKVIEKANAVIFKATPKSMFVTIMLCILETASGRLVYCSAGHTRGMVKKPDGAVRLLEVGSPLAGAFQSVEFRDGETTLDGGDTLVLYTDGVTEAQREGDLFGEERLVEFVAGMGPMAPRKVPEAIFDEVLRHTGGSLYDDVAIVAVAKSEKE